MIIAALLLAALGPAYLVWLALGRRPRPTAGLDDPPPLDLLVAVRDEAGMIEAKLRNLEALDYPPDKLRIWVIDGDSRDGTAEIARRYSEGNARVTFLRHASAGKPGQLNAALARSSAPWVLVTDADARMSASAVRTMVAAALAAPDVGAVGSEIERQSGHPLDRLYWKFLNGLWRLETIRGCASIVTGPCYLFRRDIVPSFPDGVVADDVFVALAAAASGCRVECVPAGVVELRSPEGLLEFALHKARKADAYLREIFRFLPRIGSMKGPSRTVYVWRALQLTAGPAIAAFLAASLAPRLLGAFPAVLGAAAGLAIAIAVRPVRALLRIPALGGLLGLVLMAVLLASPFWRQTACYPKVGSGAPPA